jgi:hypothetical protein
MTYNFDPDRWYEDERARLEMRRRAGQIGEDEVARAVEELDRRYESMLKRLDGTFPVAGRDAPR